MAQDFTVYSESIFSEKGMASLAVFIAKETLKAHGGDGR